VVNLTGCGVLNSKRHISNSKKIISTPPGASVTIYDKTGKEVGKGITPYSIQWQKNYDYVKFEVTGYPTQTAKLSKQFNKWFLGSFLILGSGVLLSGDVGGGGKTKTRDTTDETEPSTQTKGNMGYLVLGLGAAGVVLDVISGSFLVYKDEIHVDFTKITHTPRSRQTPDNEKGIEDVIPLAIQQATQGIAKNSTIAVLPLSTTNTTLRDFIYGESEFLLVNDGFNVVDREQLDRIRAEQKLQSTGDIDARTAVSIGKFSGADFIMTGTITEEDNQRRLRIRVLDVETADVSGGASLPFGDSLPLTSRVNIEDAVREAIRQATVKVSRNARLAIVDVRASNELKEFIHGESEFHLINQAFTVIDRGQLERIFAEQRFQRSGEVDDKTASEIGKLAGADYLISIRADGQGGLTRLRWRILNTQTALVVGMASVPFVHTQPPVGKIDLEEAIGVALQQATAKLSRNARLAIVDVISKPSIKDFLQGDAEYLLLHQGFRVVDRGQLDRVRAEQNFQRSNEVNDRTVADIGKLAGADYLLTLRADGQGGLARLRWRILNTQTALVAGVASVSFYGESSKGVATSLDKALETAIGQATKSLDKDGRIAIAWVSSPDKTDQEYISYQSESELLKQRFRVVDRGSLDRVRGELRIQRSGEVDDKTTVDIGKFAGAKYIMTGRIDGTGSLRRLRLRFLDTESAEVVGVASVMI